jgi:putative ABC transport system ATP-binding protein
MTPIVETHDLWKMYPMDGTSVKALRGVNLTVEAGEFVALVGPSGSGKSTLLHLIGAMDTPTRGEVYLNGHSLSQANDAERTRLRCHEIGFVFQTFNLLPTLSALENVEIALRLAGASRWERRARATELLQRVGLGERMSHLPQQLSGGERQRVAIARALANQPALLLADEPTGNLDSATGEAIVALLRQLNSQGQTIVLVTHDVEVAAQAERVIRMRDGKLMGQSYAPFGFAQDKLRTGPRGEIVSASA